MSTFSFKVPYEPIQLRWHNRICKDHISINRPKHIIDECRIPTKPPFKKQVTNSSKSTLFMPIVVTGKAATDPEKRECIHHYQPITEDRIGEVLDPTIRRV